MTTLPLLSASRLKVARACARLDFYRYQLGYRPVGEDKEALTFGTLVHAGLEAWWKAGSEPLAAAIAAMRAGNPEPFMLARAEAMLVGYDARWSADRDACEVIAIECEFRAPLINPVTGAASKTFELGGKLDGLIRERATGRILVLEHKTSGEDITAGSLYRRRLRMDGQVSIYFRGASALGFEASGCLYDVLAKHRLRPYQANAKRDAPETPEAFRDRMIEAVANAPDAYYARFEVARDSAELADADADAWAMAGVLRDNARTGRHPRNVDACARYGNACDYIDVCDGSASLDDATRFVRLSEVYPELAISAKPQEEAA